MLAESALVRDPAGATIAEDDRICPGCLRRLDAVRLREERQPAIPPWWTVLFMVVALGVAGPFALRAWNAYRVVLRSRTLIQDVRQFGTEGAVDRKPLLRASGLAAAREAEAAAAREAILALAMAVAGMLGVAGIAGPALRAHARHRRDLSECSLCSPPRRPGVSG